MAIGKISGPMLQTNLERQGVDLSIDGNLIYADVTNRYVGINGQPTTDFHVFGNAIISNIHIVGNTISSDTGVVNLGSNANVTISGGDSNFLFVTDGLGNLRWANIGEIASTGGILGNVINLGSNATGAFSSNAANLTVDTTVTDSVAILNEVVGKLVPPPPPVFPGGQTLSISSLSTFGRMCDFTQTDNTTSSSKQVAAGTTVTNARRANTYTTNTINDCGPGNSGNVIVFKNNTAAGYRSLTSGVDNGTYNDLIISDNVDYSTKTGDRGGFWESFDTQASGTVTEGWNEVYIRDTVALSTNAPFWYYDAAVPGTPTFYNKNIVNSSNVVAYSSTIPHYTSNAGFTITFDVNKLSGDMYPTTDNMVTGTTGGAFTAPATRTYSQVGITAPLARNLYVTSGNASVTTTSNIISGFGSSSTGPSVSVNNSYNTGTTAFAPGVTILYKTGTTVDIEETDITVSPSLGGGYSSNGVRIVNPGSGDTPVQSASATAFNSQTGTLQTYDAVVVGSGSQGVVKHDQTDYSTGYLPVGPNLSVGRSGAQYFTFKFQRTVVSKFNITYSGTIAGLWVALPGSVIDSTSTLNGWLDISTAYSGSGTPGANTGAGGNGSNGCALAGTATLNSAVSNKAVTATFGGVSSSSTGTNEIYVRVKLTSGQSLTALSIGVATN
jgi:hypothetical protein